MAEHSIFGLGSRVVLVSTYCLARYVCRSTKIPPRRTDKSLMVLRPDKPPMWPCGGSSSLSHLCTVGAAVLARVANKNATLRVNLRSLVFKNQVTPPTHETVKARAQEEVPPDPIISTHPHKTRAHAHIACTRSVDGSVPQDHLKLPYLCKCCVLVGSHTEGVREARGERLYGWE